jgi:hypothetical protein
MTLCGRRPKQMQPTCPNVTHSAKSEEQNARHFGTRLI